MTKLKTTSVWRRGLTVALGMVIASAPLTTVEAGQNGRRGGGASSGEIRAVLDFDGDWTVEFPQVNSFIRVPTVCQTTPYVAGPNEVAIVNIDGFIGPSSTTFPNIMELDLAISENGGAFSIVTARSTLANMSSTVAEGALNKRVALVEGVTYVFGAGFSVYAPVINAYSVCHGVVTIARLPS